MIDLVVVVDNRILDRCTEYYYSLDRDESLSGLLSGFVHLSRSDSESMTHPMTHLHTVTDSPDLIVDDSSNSGIDLAELF